MKFLPVLGVLLVATASASAEPDSPKFSVGGGAEIGGIAREMEYRGRGMEYGGLTLEGSYRLSKRPLFARAQIARGIGFGDGSYSHDYLQGRVGLEYRQRLGVDWLHAYGGVDLGVVRLDEMDEMTQRVYETDAALLVVPRAGIQIGNRLYGRLGAEVPLYVLLTNPGNELGFAFTATFGASF